MRRKALWLSFGLLLLVVGSVLGTLVVLAKQEPAFYTRCSIPPGPERQDSCVKLGLDVHNLKEAIKTGDNWRGTFSDTAINCFLEEVLVEAEKAKEFKEAFLKYLPESISQPRVVFEKDRIRLGFRYGTSLWKTIISIDLRLWVAKQEPNVLVVELEGLHAGALPISSQSLLEEISETLRRQNVRVTWYRREGNPTATLQLPCDQLRPAAQLSQIELRPGTLTVLGHSNEPK